MDQIVIAIMWWERNCQPVENKGETVVDSYERYCDGLSPAQGDPLSLEEFIEMMRCVNRYYHSSNFKVFHFIPLPGTDDVLQREIRIYDRARAAKNQAGVYK